MPKTTVAVIRNKRTRREHSLTVENDKYNVESRGKHDDDFNIKTFVDPDNGKPIKLNSNEHSFQTLRFWFKKLNAGKNMEDIEPMDESIREELETQMVLQAMVGVQEEEEEDVDEEEDI